MSHLSLGPQTKDAATGPHSQPQGSEPFLMLFLGSEQSSYMVPVSPMVQGTLRVGALGY